MTDTILLTAVSDAQRAAIDDTDFADALLFAYDQAREAGRGDVEEALEVLDPDDPAAAIEPLSIIVGTLSVD